MDIGKSVAHSLGLKNDDPQAINANPELTLNGKTAAQNQDCVQQVACGAIQQRQWEHAVL